MNEIARIFLKLGFFGFGGPIATMAMMEEEVSRKRQWLSASQFAEIYAVCKVLPGPAATQMAIYLGYLRGKKLGGLLAGLLFIGPSFLIVLAISAYYAKMMVSSGQAHFLTGMQVGALVVILLSTLQLAQPFKTKWNAWVIAMISAAVVAIRPGLEPIVILAFGLGGIWLGKIDTNRGAKDSKAREVGSLLALSWVCFKAGAFVFGTGLAIVPVLEADVVTKYHWLTHSQFMDGLSIGQVTPGPVVITATFIGYQVSGVLGACIATAMIFMPAFINILFIVPHIWKKVSGTPAAKRFTSGAIPAVIGGIAGTTLKLGILTIHGPFLLGLFLGALALNVRFKIPAWTMIPVCGLVGLLA